MLVLFHLISSIFLSSNAPNIFLKTMALTKKAKEH